MPASLVASNVSAVQSHPSTVPSNISVQWAISSIGPPIVASQPVQEGSTLTPRPNIVSLASEDVLSAREDLCKIVPCAEQTQFLSFPTIRRYT